MTNLIILPIIRRGGTGKEVQEGFEIYERQKHQERNKERIGRNKEIWHVFWQIAKPNSKFRSNSKFYAEMSHCANSPREARGSFLV